MNTLLTLMHDTCNKTSLIGSTIKVMELEGIENLNQEQTESLLKIKRWVKDIDNIMDAFYENEKKKEIT